MAYRLLPLLFITCLCTCVRAQNAYEVFRFDEDGETIGLLPAMRASNTPTMSMAVDNGRLDTAFTAAADGAAPLVSTLYRAGAASAGPVCVAVLQLVERGAIGLDDKINALLSSGRLQGGDMVTVRDLLQMRAFTGSGYKPDGYRAGEARPSLTEIAESLRYKGVRKADKSTEYGGWIYLQLLLEQHYNSDLNSILQREVFGPLGLQDMVYATELDGERAGSAAPGHDEKGQPLEDGYRRYVALAAAGLWTSAQDYVTFTRAILDISEGKADGILQPATVEMALADRYGHRSLIFHYNDNGLPFWGGNALGYYFTMQAHPAEKWVAVSVMNRNLNWRLGGPVVWQLGLFGKQLRSEERLGIVLQDADRDNPLASELEHYCFTAGIRTERLTPAGGLPTEITATPAFVYQGNAGRALYSGRHDDRAAIERFLRQSRVAPQRPVADLRNDVFTYRAGRQQTVLETKFTPPSGQDAPADWPASLQADLLTSLESASGFRRQAEARLQPTDRRLYLDLHAYRTANGNYQLTYALFSQFNCHEPVITNYGQPASLQADGRGAELLTERIGVEIKRMMQLESGFVPRPLPAVTPAISWGELGWALPDAVLAGQRPATYARPAAVAGNYRAAFTTADPPALFFSFPAPLDRYAGEVGEFTADFRFGTRGETVSGKVELPVASIKTSSAALDTYVLGDLLKSEKHPTASLTFGPQTIAADFYLGQQLPTMIQGELTMRGKTYPVVINATFTPDADGNLYVTAAFMLDFKQVFGGDGPDGPEEVRRRLEFRAAFTATILE